MLRSAEKGANDRENETAKLEKELDALTINVREKHALCERLRDVCSSDSAELETLIEDKNAALVLAASAEKDAARAAEDLARTDSDIENEKAEHARICAKISETTGKAKQKKKKAEENRLVRTSSGGEVALLEKKSHELHEKINELDEKNNALRGKFMDKTHTRELKFREFTALETKRTQILSRRETISGRIRDEYDLTYAQAQNLGYPAVTEKTRPEAAAKAADFKNRMKSLGHVNVGAIDEYAEIKERYDFLTAQVSDLRTSRDDLTEIIRKLESEMKVKFAATVDDVNGHFKTVFRELFGGGSAQLSLTDPENILESGIEIRVAPPGKIIKNMSLLSGGEQVFVAIALLFAILKVNPTPFCLLDEIEAALDEVNVTKFAEYAKKFSHTTQFIIITHRRGTMEVADTLYGVTMQERGVSSVLSINVNEAEKKLGVKLN